MISRAIARLDLIQSEKVSADGPGIFTRLKTLEDGLKDDLPKVFEKIAERLKALEDAPVKMPEDSEKPTVEPEVTTSKKSKK